MSDSRFLRLSVHDAAENELAYVIVTDIPCLDPPVKDDFAVQPKLHPMVKKACELLIEQLKALE